MKKIIITLIFILGVCNLYSQTKFKHILITNDDGIEDSKRLLALAKSVSNHADKVSIIVSAFDRSGTSNHSMYGKYNSTFEATCKYNDEMISFYTIPGNPADCVMLGLGGFFGEETPDLVISGINGGTNIGPNWFGSGTIGAARTAAFYGVKSIALSGFDDDNEKSFVLLPEWISNFIGSGILDSLKRGDYLTISFPKIPFTEIKGIKILKRRIYFDHPEVFKLKKIWGGDSSMIDKKTIWTLEIDGNPYSKDLLLDNDFLKEGYVIITPMKVDENNPDLLDKLRLKHNLIPHFPK